MKKQIDTTEPAISSNGVLAADAVNNLIYSVNCGDGNEGIMCLTTGTVFCYCNEQNADIILDAIIKAYEM